MLKALILKGDGINCEIETANAARFAGFESQILHINDLAIDQGKILSDISLLLLPGGFSFGDELGSGKVLALKLQFAIGAALTRYIDRGGALLGICNGFQALVRMGYFGKNTSLSHNAQGHFINHWTGLQITGSSIFTDPFLKRGIDYLELPIRHGEGRIVVADPMDETLVRSQTVLRYKTDVNGSFEKTAGLATKNGRVMGMMPHPEAFWTAELHPWQTSEKVPLGVALFENAYQELLKNQKGM